MSSVIIISDFKIDNKGRFIELSSRYIDSYFLGYTLLDRIESGGLVSKGMMDEGDGEEHEVDYIDKKSIPGLLNLLRSLNAEYLRMHIVDYLKLINMLENFDNITSKATNPVMMISL